MGCGIILHFIIIFIFFLFAIGWWISVHDYFIIGLNKIPIKSSIRAIFFPYFFDIGAGMKTIGRVFKVYKYFFVLPVHWLFLNTNTKKYQLSNQKQEKSVININKYSLHLLGFGQLVSKSNILRRHPLPQLNLPVCHLSCYLIFDLR